MKLKTLLLSFILSLLVTSSALAVTYTPQVSIPSPDNTGSFNKAYTFKNNGTIEPIGLLIKDVMKYLIGIAGILGTIMLMYGGFLYIISGGQGKLITDAQNHIVSAIVGIVLAATSYLILATVNPDLVNLKATTINSIQASGCCKSDTSCSTSKSQSDCKSSSDFVKNGICYQSKCLANAAELKEEQIAADEKNITNTDYGKDCTNNFGTIEQLTGENICGVMPTAYDAPDVTGSESKLQFTCCIQPCKNPANLGKSCAWYSGSEKLWSGYCSPDKKCLDKTVVGNIGEWCGDNAAGKCYTPEWVGPISKCPGTLSTTGTGGRDCNSTTVCCK